MTTKLTPKERRARLFQHGKPVIRDALLEDLAWFGVAARMEGYEGPAEEILANWEEQLGAVDRVWVLEDRCPGFKGGSGPVGVMMAHSDGWTVIPHALWFPWAQAKHKLRGTVAFLQHLRYSHEVGCIKISANASHRKWFTKLRRYVLVVPVGRIPAGRPDGDEYIFYTRGRAKYDRDSKLNRGSGDERPDQQGARRPRRSRWGDAGTVPDADPAPPSLRVAV